MIKPASPLSIAICAFNAVEYTKLLVDSIRKYSAYQHEIVIYSDGSSDGTLEWLRSQGDVLWRHDRKNRGICTAMNRAAKMATREYLFFPNTDHVLAPGWDTALLRRLSRRKVVSTQCIEPGIVPVASIFHTANCGTRFDEFNEPAFIEAAAGFSRDAETPGINYPFAMSKSLWKEVGGLDERFDPGPANDPDLFYRLSFLGAHLVRAEDVVIYHFSGKSSRMAGEARQEDLEWHRITDRNEARFEEKWGERYQYANGGLPNPGPAARERWALERPHRSSLSVNTPFTVAIDARSVGEKEGGIRAYTLNLVQALVRLKEGPRVHCLSGNAGDLKRDLRSDEGIVVHDLRSSDLESGRDDLLQKLIQEQSCDVFHGPAFAIPPGVGIPSVVTIHDVAFLTYPDFYPPGFRRHLKGVMEGSLTRAREIIAVSDHTKRELAALYPWAASRVVRIHEAAPSTGLVPAEDSQWTDVKRKWSGGRDFILSVGVQQRRKNASGLVRAFALMEEAIRSRFNLVLVGGTECEDATLAHEIDRLKLKSQVVLTPHLDRAEVSALYGSCSLFVYPSLCEGFGFPPLEAMTHGRPVVCSDGGALGEVAGPGALVYPAGDETALANAMGQVLSDEQLQAELIQKGKANLLTFSWDKAAHETMESYLRAKNSTIELSTQAPAPAPLKRPLTSSLAEPAPARHRPPRVAVDARLANLRSLGTGRYTAEILKALLSSPEELDLVVIGPKDLDLSGLPNVERIIQHVPAEMDTLLNAAWEQFSLPSHLLGCDLYFAPTGVVPIARPCKAVPVIHDLGFEDYPDFYEPRLRAYLSKWLRHSCATAERVITVSSFTRNRIAALYNVPADRLSVVHHGRPESRALDSTSGGRPQGSHPAIEDFVLAVSSFEPNKNLAVLIQAFDRIMEKWKGKLILAGRTGQDLPTLKRAIQETRAPKRILLVENPDDAAVDKLFREASLFVFPSVYEGFGIPLVEAMTAGLPIIAKRGSSCPEILGTAGVLLDDLTPESLAAAMTSVLSNPDHSRQLRERSLARSLDFSWSTAGRQTWSVLKECLERG